MSLMSLISPSPRRRLPAPFRAWLLVGSLVAATALAAPQAEETSEQEVVYPSGLAKLTLDGQPVGTVAFSLPPAGPLVALPTLTALLGVELRVGPLGQSHRLVFADKEVLVGPGQAMMITVTGGDGHQEQITTFAQPPRKAAGGLQVPIDFLVLTLGDELGYEVAWNGKDLQLDLNRRRQRELEATVDLIHQHSSTVEIRFSAEPRYRVEHPPGAVEIRLLGDRLKLPVTIRRTQSPLVRQLSAGADRVRIELVESAGAAEPRLVRTPAVALVIEVFHQPALPAEDEGEPAAPEPPRGIRTVVVDPGHGGSETGAIAASGTAEKDLTLMIGRDLQRRLQRRLPVRVVLTRTEDVDLPLASRTALANQNKADLFISLHFNSSFGPTAHGAETYFLSREASDQLAAEVAALENLANGDNDDPELDLQLILWDLAQSYHLAESQRFANLVQEELNLTLGLRDRGVKQAPFRVLTGAMMPAVLVELGFLSNPEEDSKLQGSGYRAELVESLLRAIIRFKTQLEAREEPAAEDEAGELP